MAHAIWHMDYGKYWKDKLMSGASAVQEGVVDPLFDRAMGTAPGIPPRPWGGPSPYQGRPPSAQFAGESGGPPARATRRGPPPRLFFGGGMGPSMDQIDQAKNHKNMSPMSLRASPYPGALPSVVEPSNNSLVGQGPIPKGTPGVGDKPIPWEWTEAAGSGQQELTPQKVQPPGPVAIPTRSVAADPSQYPVARPGGFNAEKAAALSRGERGRTPVGPFKKEIAEASAVEGEAITEDDKLKRMLKMMFLSDLVKGTEAPNPDYYSAISVGPASRAFAPLPSMFRGR
jgi:hypothetical protein